MAEGVENQETLRHLAALGCDFAQGSLFCEPLGVDDVVGWLQSCERVNVAGFSDPSADRNPPTELRAC